MTSDTGLFFNSHMFTDFNTLSSPCTPLTCCLFSIHSTHISYSTLPSCSHFSFCLSWCSHNLTHSIFTVSLSSFYNLWYAHRVFCPCYLCFHASLTHTTLWKSKIMTTKQPHALWTKKLGCFPLISCIFYIFQLNKDSPVLFL